MNRSKVNAGPTKGSKEANKITDHHRRRNNDPKCLDCEDEHEYEADAVPIIRSQLSLVIVHEDER